jgi:predicted HicB family RNase H-like nuclease
MSIGQLPDDSRNVEKKSTTTMTFRIDSDIILLMKEKAEQEGITLNTLVSHVLKRYA